MFSAPTPSVAAKPGDVIFYDDFVGSSLDTSKWLAHSRDSDQSNSEVNWYLPANVAVSGGNLLLTSKFETSNGRAYTSGGVQWQNFSFRFGTVEGRSLNNSAVGTWFTFWLLGTDCLVTNITTPNNVPPCSWDAPGSDEIDISEYNGDTGFFGTNQSLFTAAGGGRNTNQPLSDTRVNWHVTKLVWTPSALTWFIDGVQTFTTSANIPQRAMFMIINVAVGGAGGTPSSGTFPSTTTFDYVKVTQG